MINANLVRAKRYLRNYEPKLTQDQISAEGMLVVGKAAQISKRKQGFLRSLPNTKRGLAVRAGHLKRRKCRSALFDEVQKLKGKRGNAKAQVNVNLDWWERLPTSYGGECYVDFDEDWLSEERVKEVTGLTFDDLVAFHVAPPALIYVASEQDLHDSDRAIHFAREGSLFLDRNIPRNMSHKSADWRYFPADDEDGFVPEWEAEGRDGPPTNKGHYNTNKPEPKVITL